MKIKTLEAIRHIFTVLALFALIAGGYYLIHSEFKICFGYVLAFVGFVCMDEVVYSKISDKYWEKNRDKFKPFS